MAMSSPGPAKRLSLRQRESRASMTMLPLTSEGQNGAVAVVGRGMKAQRREAGNENGWQRVSSDPATLAGCAQARKRDRGGRGAVSGEEPGDKGKR